MPDKKRKPYTVNPNHDTRFKPGVSGNPGGKPAKCPYREAYRMLASGTMKDLEVKPDDTPAERIAKTFITKAIKKGDVRAAKEAADRTEGAPTQILEHTGPEGGPIVIANAKDKLAGKLLRE